MKKWLQILFLLFSCFKDCDHITYLPRVTSAEFRSKTFLPSFDNFWPNPCSVHATLETWTWAPSATWPPPPWQCGNQASWRPMATWPPATSTRQQGHSDSTTQTLWAIGSSYPHSPRYEVFKAHIHTKTFLSGPSVQRLQKGHRNCEHLFWGTYSIWWVATSFWEFEKCISRKCEITKDDLVGLHLRLWRPLWTLPWNQLCVSCWDYVLVLHQIVQEFNNWR